FRLKSMHPTAWTKRQFRPGSNCRKIDKQSLDDASCLEKGRYVLNDIFSRSGMTIRIFVADAIKVDEGERAGTEGGDLLSGRKRSGGTCIIPVLQFPLE